jgi:hypothetical protein
MKKFFIYLSILFIFQTGFLYAKISQMNENEKYEKEIENEIFILEIEKEIEKEKEIVKKRKKKDRNTLKLELFTKKTSAKCLDGSPYGVNYAKGYESGKNKVIISFWGGGWCSGRDTKTFYEDCINRSKTVLGSSKNWDDHAYYEGGFLGGEPNQNINFYNWNRFEFPYCDGTGHQGHITDPIKIRNETLHFKGHINTIEGFMYILDKVKIEEMEELVVTGCSAGGLATFYWIQYFADYIHLRNNKVKIYGIPDSGFFVDHINLKTKDNDYKLKQKILFEEVNKEVLPVNTLCVKENLNEIYKCLLAENLFKYIKVPILMIQPGYDSWQLQNILNQDCAANGNINQCNEKDLNIANEYREYQNKLIEKELKINNNLSAWSPSCVIHCFGQNEQLSPSWQVPKDSGNNIDFVVREFLEKEGKVQIELLDKVNWPENDKCARKDHLKY